ncbi:hypothetical protein Gogos_005971 [Gossypium gossypioides]|uniref:Uncharacterized protein n=1 Tax=Gossypium gossypioides TaxID=34282 RepID=A0A7J9C4E2_GOSGO|nr:hypothetical protein [Gossypium gossypioides]
MRTNQLIHKLNHDKVAQQNAQLKQEASELRQMLSDMQLSNPRYLEGVSLATIGFPSVFMVVECQSDSTKMDMSVTINAFSGVFSGVWIKMPLKIEH